MRKSLGSKRKELSDEHIDEITRMNADSKEAAFQQDVIDQMVVGGWNLGDPLVQCN